MTQETAIAKVPEGEIAEADMMALIKRTVARGATDDELQMFLYHARKAGLDPLARQIHFIKRKVSDGKGGWIAIGTIQVGIDGLRAIAERTESYDGQDEPSFQYDEKGALVSATVRVYRRGHTRPSGATAHYAEYVQSTKTGEPNSMWRKCPHVMLAKCAESLALRKAFPLVLSGLYTHEEMQQADSEEVIDRSKALAVEKGLADAQERGDIEAKPAESQSEEPAIETDFVVDEIRGPEPEPKVPQKEPKSKAHYLLSVALVNLAPNAKDQEVLLKALAGYTDKQGQRHEPESIEQLTAKWAETTVQKARQLLAEATPDMTIEDLELRALEIGLPQEQ